jgi:uncharacterized protein YjiS (DUF1127 family)
MTRFCENGMHDFCADDVVIAVGGTHVLVPRQGAAASKSWWARVFDESALAIRQMWHAYWHWRARQDMLMFLHSIDERTLKDFGATREEMHSFLDKQFTLGTAGK